MLGIRAVGIGDEAVAEELPAAAKVGVNVDIGGQFRSISAIIYAKKVPFNVLVGIRYVNFLLVTKSKEDPLGGLKIRFDTSGGCGTIGQKFPKSNGNDYNV